MIKLIKSEEIKHEITPSTMIGICEVVEEMNYDLNHIKTTKVITRDDYQFYISYEIEGLKVDLSKTEYLYLVIVGMNEQDLINHIDNIGLSDELMVYILDPYTFSLNQKLRFL